MARKPTNNAPVCKWFGVTMACGTYRQRLYVNGSETPYFIDSAATIGHRTQGNKHGLYGAGMGPEVRRHDGSTYRIACAIASASKIAILKHQAEQFGLSAFAA